MFLSREIDIKLCKIYTKIHIYAILYKSWSIKLNKYATNLKTTSLRISGLLFYFAFLIDIIDNFITYNLYYVTRTSANASAVSLSRNKDGNRVTSILHCHWLKFMWRNTDFHFSFTVPLNTAIVCNVYTFISLIKWFYLNIVFIIHSFLILTVSYLLSQWTLIYLFT